MEAMVSTALGAIERELDDDFQTVPPRSPSLYERTIQNFRPNVKASRPGRGRPSTVIKFKVFLLPKPFSKVPLKTACTKISECGLGSPKKTSKNGYIFFKKIWTVQEIKEHIISLYPEFPLSMAGFYLAKSGKNRILTRLEFQTVSSLKKALFRGKLFVIPNINLQEVSNSGSMEHEISETVAEDDVPEIEKTNVNSSERVCPDCHRTLTDLECIYCIQDKEFQESLHVDQEKDRCRKEEDRLEEMRCQRKQNLSDEPDEGVRLKFKTAVQSFQRKFLQKEKVEVFLNYVGSLDGSSEHFSVRVPNGVTVLSNCKNKTIDELGISNNTLLHVNWLTEEEMKEMEKQEEQLDRSILPESNTEEGLPALVSVRPRMRRPLRRAAVRCTSRIHSWLTAPNGIVNQTSSQSSRILSPTSTVTSDTYRNYVDVVTISESESESSSEDEVLPIESGNSSEENVIITLTRLQTLINRRAVTRLNIHRPSIWDVTVRKLTSANFKPENDLLVKFSDEFGTSEEGIDQGGPKREYLCLVMEYLLNSHLFEGPPDSRILSMNKAACDNNHYLAAGRLIALSIVHGGPAPHCFSPLLVHALQFGPKETKVKLSDLPDGEMKEDLKELLNAQTQAARSKALEKVEAFLNYAGITYFNCVNQENAEQLVQTASHSYIFDRTSEAFRQFRQGLNILQVHENIGNLKELFLFKPITWNQDIFENLFQYDVDEPGSNCRNNQSQCIAFWRDYLEEVAEGTARLKFSQILQFCTGAKEVPPLGFSPNPTIAFWEEKFPKANTCANTLVLPCLSRRYKDFVDNLEFGILNAQGFLIE